jgi:hypothetical protein
MMHADGSSEEGLGKFIDRSSFSSRTAESTMTRIQELYCGRVMKDANAASRLLPFSASWGT